MGFDLYWADDPHDERDYVRAADAGIAYAKEHYPDDFVALQYFLYRGLESLGSYWRWSMPMMSAPSSR